jgi:hypothetical protein
MRHLKQQGHSNQSIMDAANATGYKLSDRVKNRFAKWEAKETTPTPPTNQTPTPTPTPDPQPSQEIENPNSAVEAKERVQGFINTGDAKDSPGAAVGTGNAANTQKDIGNTENDIKTDSGNVTNNPVGNNNFISTDIDSSVRTYGGSNRVFNYQGGSGESSLYDSPVSAATMGGYYDVDDSPAAQAKFVNLHSGINEDNQKRYAGQALSGAMAAITMNNQLPSVDYEARKAANRQEADDRRTISNINLFGDRDFAKGYLPDYEFGADPKPIEDPFEKDDDDDD